MANGWVVVLGIFLLFIAFIGYFSPVSEGFTAPQVNELCSSDLGQLGQFFGGENIRDVCREFEMATFAIYGSGLIGIILIIVGAVVSGKTGKDTSTVCKYCNFVGQTEAELLDHKAKNHLDKSPFKCEHCDFIGITEEILWNHYKDKHPDKKKW